MKASFYIISEKPFTISIKKNKRAVSEAVAKLLVQKEFPEASEEGWAIGKGEHRTLATRKDDWVPKK